MIHQHIQTLNALLLAVLPHDCGVPLWKTQMNGLVKLVIDTADKTKARKMHDQADSWIVRDDGFDLQTAHIIDRVRVERDSFETFPTFYIVECSWIGVSTKSIAGLLALSVFEREACKGIDSIEHTSLDNNTESVLLNYWGIDRDSWGQNPAYQAWRIQYRYSLSQINPEDLYLLEGITDFDPVTY